MSIKYYHAEYIAGFTVGGVGILVCCCGLAVLWFCRTRKSKPAPVPVSPPPPSPAKGPHKCGFQFSAGVCSTDPVTAADGSALAAARTMARTTVCPHVSVRNMAFGAAKALGTIPASASKEDASLQWYVTVGQAQVYTADREGTQPVTWHGITAEASATLVVSIRRGPPATSLVLPGTTQVAEVQNRFDAGVSSRGIMVAV
jgi:hypothetical protein